MTAFLLLGVALASQPSEPSEPTPPVLPWAAPWEVQAAYDAHRARTGREPRPLACGPLWKDAVRLCLQREEAGRLTRLHTGELSGSWSMARDRLASGAAAWVRGEVERVEVEGMEADYRRVRDVRGRAVLAVLAPEVLAEDVGLPLAMAIPSTGVVLAWKGGNPELDKVMAVGVKELHDQAKDRVSAEVWAWDGERWFPFAEATPTATPDPARATEPG